jgi:hypothetical protein
LRIGERKYGTSNTPSLAPDDDGRLSRGDAELAHQRLGSGILIEIDEAVGQSVARRELAQATHVG